MAYHHRGFHEQETYYDENFDLDELFEDIIHQDESVVHDASQLRRIKARSQIEEYLERKRLQEDCQDILDDVWTQDDLDAGH
ncbi:MAG: hypothetical protein CMF50_06150 [Legionellales bacterium]|nr:hypothetical protein [Legionellales bacterium]|tara:strand:- start:8126 stop:8371 length:246 start_codon:yes stop_codon:yes gene_type:complete